VGLECVVPSRTAAHRAGHNGSTVWSTAIGSGIRLDDQALNQLRERVVAAIASVSRQLDYLKSTLPLASPPALS
jgi:hypothetical protein